MNTRIQKEIRALWRIWIGSLVLVLSPLLLGCILALVPGSSNVEWITIVPICSSLLIPASILVAIAPFGFEMIDGKMGFLLAQPVNRRVLWFEKLGVTSMGILALFLIYAIIIISAREILNRTDIPIGWAIPVFILGLGPLIALLTRRDAAAFWLTFMLVGFFTVWLEDIAVRLGFTDERMFRTGCFAVLGMIGFVLTYKGFMGWQDRDWIGCELNLPNFFKGTRSHPIKKNSATRPWQALVLKELRLQQMNFIFITGFITLILLFLFACRFERSWEEKGHVDAAVMFLRLVFMVSPVFFGAIAMSEERRLGIHDWQATFPISIHRQWWAKFGVAAVLSLIFGSFLHYGLERSNWILESISPGISLALKTGQIMDSTAKLIFFVLIPIMGLVIGFYASSLSRHLLQALSVAIGLLAVSNLVFGLLPLFAWPGIDRFPQSLIVVILALPTCTLVMLWLSRRNWTSIGDFKDIAKTNIWVLSCTAIAILLTGAFLYYRTWELATIPNPSKTKYQTATGKVPTFQSGMSSYGLLISTDGSLWQYGLDLTEKKRPNAINRIRFPKQIGRDTDWKQALCKGESVGVIGLKNDGSLWALGNNPQWLGLPEVDYVETMQRIGKDSDWVKIDGNFSTRTLGLKEDGSLWIWGRQSEMGSDNKLALNPEPTRVGTENDWTDIILTGSRNFALKKDGTVWHWGSEYRYSGNSEKLPPTSQPVQAVRLPASIRLTEKLNGIVGLTEKGKFWSFPWSISLWDKAKLKKEFGLNHLESKEIAMIAIDSKGELFLKGYEGHFFPEGELDHGLEVWADFNGGYDDYPYLYSALTPDGTFWESVFLEHFFDHAAGPSIPIIPPKWRLQPVGRLVDGAVFE